MDFCVGVDIGISGAIAEIDVEKAAKVDHRLYSVNVIDMPTKKVGGRRVYDVEKIKGFMFQIPGSCYVVIEQVHAMPKHLGGSASAFSMGRGLGIFEAFASLLSGVDEWHDLYDYDLVSPMRWKRDLGLMRRGKDASRLLAERLFPGVDLGKRKDQGRSEALLIAFWGMMQRLKGDKWLTILLDQCHRDGLTGPVASSGT